MEVDQARRLKELEREDLRLRQAVPDLTLNKLILKEGSEIMTQPHSFTDLA